MISKTNRKPRRLDSDNLEHEASANEAAEKKVLAVWKAFEEFYGKRWHDNFGNDPLGKSDAGQRMGQWIEALKYISWPAIKQAIVKIRDMPREWDGWLPDLQSFLQAARKLDRPITRSIESEKPLYPSDGVDETANLLMVEYLYRKGGCSPQSATHLFLISREVAEIYRLLLTEDKTITKGDMAVTLEKRWDKVWEAPSLEDLQTLKEKFLIRRSLPGKGPSSSSMPSGRWVAAEQ